MLLFFQFFIYFLFKFLTAISKRTPCTANLFGDICSFLFFFIVLGVQRIHIFIIISFRFWDPPEDHILNSLINEDYPLPLLQYKNACIGKWPGTLPKLVEYISSTFPFTVDTPCAVVMAGG